MNFGRANIMRHVFRVMTRTPGLTISASSPFGESTRRSTEYPSLENQFARSIIVFSPPPARNDERENATLSFLRFFGIHMLDSSKPSHNQTPILFLDGANKSSLSFNTIIAYTVCIRESFYFL